MRKYGPNGEDRRTFEEWLEDSRRESLEFVRQSAVRLKWEATRTLDVGDDNLAHTGWNSVGILDYIGYTLHLEKLTVLREVAKRYQADRVHS